MMTTLVMPISGCKGEDSEVFEHFGRAPYFVCVPVESGEDLRFLEKAPSGGGCMGTVSHLLEHGAGAVAAAGMGGRPLGIFREHGVPVYQVAAGLTVKDVRKAFEEGRLSPMEQACG